MTDIRTIMTPSHDPADPPRFDWAIQRGDLAPDDGLETAVILSLFTDRRARPDDPLPDGSDRRGWWADAYPRASARAGQDPIGSRLWLLEREKDTREVVNRARDYAEEALQWLVDDGIAERIEVMAGWVEQSGELTELKTATVIPGVLGIGAVIYRPLDPPAKYRFQTPFMAS